MSWLFSVVNERSSRPAPTPRAYSRVSRSVPFEQCRLGHRADGTGVNRHPSLLSIARLKLFLPPTIASPSPGAVGRAGYRRGEAQLDRKSSEARSRAGRDGDRRRPAAQDPRKRRSITLTFIRHAESEANASGIINAEGAGTGPEPTGQRAGRTPRPAPRRHNDYDSIYASTMVRPNKPPHRWPANSASK